MPNQSCEHFSANLKSECWTACRERSAVGILKRENIQPLFRSGPTLSAGSRTKLKPIWPRCRVSGTRGLNDPKRKTEALARLRETRCPHLPDENNMSVSKSAPKHNAESESASAFNLRIKSKIACEVGAAKASNGRAINLNLRHANRLLTAAAKALADAANCADNQPAKAGTSDLESNFLSDLKLVREDVRNLRAAMIAGAKFNEEKRNDARLKLAELKASNIGFEARIKELERLLGDLPTMGPTWTVGDHLRFHWQRMDWQMADLRQVEKLVFER